MEYQKDPNPKCGSRISYLDSHDFSPVPSLDDLSWVPPLHFLEESCLTEVKGDVVHLETDQEGKIQARHKLETRSKVEVHDNGKGLKLRIKYKKKETEAKFSPGTCVEVKSDEDGYSGSWYTASIVGSVGFGKFLVEYRTLKTDDETELLKEFVNEQDIRPYPAHICQVYKYEEHQEVDAWYNGGWWDGIVSEVLDGWKYAVYFASTNDKIVYQHFDLRPHQNWVHGKWAQASQKRSFNMTTRGTSPKRKHDLSKFDDKFVKGMTVEVRSDEQGYEGSWYTAVIVGSKRNDRLLVEYLTLKTEDGRKFLREETGAQNIRPSPPEREVDDEYHLLQRVGAWYNEGWWVGVISRVLAIGKYMVYLTTKEEMEFDDVNLRIHQEWVNREWIIEDSKG